MTWDKLPECIFENEGDFKIFKNCESDLSPKSLNQTCGYWVSWTIAPEENCPATVNLTLTLTQYLNLTGGNFPRGHRPDNGYWLIAPNQQTLCIESNVFNSGNYESASGQLQNRRQFQNNSINNAMLITMNRLIK